MNLLLCLVFSYLLGSVSPSFFFGKLVKGIDVREHGDHNAGGVNTFATVGFVPGVITTAFDLSKGLIALAAAVSIFGLTGELLLLPIGTALVGHVFPFYLHFRGGQGAATAVGVVFYFLGVLLAHGSLPWEGLALVAAIGVVTAIATPFVEFIGVAMIPLLIYVIIHSAGMGFPGSATVLLLIYLLGVTSYNLIRKGILASEAFRSRNWWMIATVSSGTLLLLLLCLWGSLPTAVVAVAVVGTFLFTGIAQWYRRRDRDAHPVLRFTAIPWRGAIFYLGAFLITVIDSQHAAAMALACLIGGTLFEELFGTEQGWKVIRQASTLRSAAVFVGGCLVGGEIVATALGVSMIPLLIAAAVAFLVVLLTPLPYQSVAVALTMGLVIFALVTPHL